MFYRALELVIVVSLLALLLPLMLIIALLIKTKDGGGVFYLQDRVGLSGTIFKIYKFRSMYQDSEEDGPKETLSYTDARITPFGRFLRRTKIDELPQLINVLKGDMALVGPRPERPYLHESFSKELSGWEKRLQVKPGITGLAQTSGKVWLTPEEKLALDLEYVAKRSIVLDARILLATPREVFR